MFKISAGLARSHSQAIPNIDMKYVIFWLASLLAFCGTASSTNKDFGFKIGHAYDPRYEKCCGASPYSITGSHQYLKCCGDHQYDVTEQVCCNGTVHYLKGGFGCCSDVYINLTLEYCCSNGGKSQANAIPEEISNVTVGKFLNCCCNETYDIRTQLCCECAVLPKSADNVSCCGTTTYVSTPGFECCNGSVVPFPSQYYACCGNTSFDSQNFFCCGTKVHEKLNRYSRNYRTNDGCCGDKRFDNRLQLCCDDIDGKKFVVTPPGGVGYYRCCGSLPYHSNSDVCCQINETQIVKKKQNYQDTQCCGNETFNAAGFSCCNDHIVQKTDYRANLCCGFYPYNNYSQICCYDEELRQHRSYVRQYGSQCCGIVPYFPERETCVNKQVLPLTRGYSSCSGKRYNQQTELCCGGNVVEKIQTNVTYACCGSYGYVIGQEICCYDMEVRPITNPGQTACCIAENSSNSTMCCPCTASYNNWRQPTTRKPYYTG